MSHRPHLVLVVTLAVTLAACAPLARLEMADVADGAEAPPDDPELAAAGDAGAAAWIDRSTRRTGAPVVVKYFASWCGPCEEEVPVLQRAREAHPDVTFLGIAHQDPRPDAREWMADVGVDDLPTLLDIEGETARTFGARGMPSVSFVDAEGRLQYTHTGPIDEQLLEEWIDHLQGDGPRPETRPQTPASSPR